MRVHVFVLVALVCLVLSWLVLCDLSLGSLVLTCLLALLSSLVFLIWSCLALSCLVKKTADGKRTEFYNPKSESEREPNRSFFDLGSGSRLRSGSNSGSVSYLGTSLKTKQDQHKTKARLRQEQEQE